MRVFVTGASGLIGRRLLPLLQARGDTVVALSRNSRPTSAGITWVVGDPAITGPWLDELNAADAVIHLAGEPIIGKRWSAAVLDLIRSSRVVSTRLIAERLAQQPFAASGQPKSFVSGSAIGIYGADSGPDPHSEDAPAAADPVAQIVVDWEAAAEPARRAGVRVVHPRTGIVLDRAGGALPKMDFPFRLFLGGRIGTGKQYVSWIHHTDMSAVLLRLLDDQKLTGAWNATAPNPTTNAEFSRLLGKVLRRPSWLPVPRFALRILVGQAVQIVAGGQNAPPTRLLQSGFPFQYPDLESALRALYSE
jgi:uncharacterized protein (TIGR01777 family)